MTAALRVGVVTRPMEPLWKVTLGLISAKAFKPRHVEFMWLSIAMLVLALAGLEAGLGTFTRLGGG